MMGPKIIQCEQGTPEWFKARMGIPTASMFHAVQAKTPDGKRDGKTREDYMYKLAGERLSGEPMDGYKNAAMERGNAMEAEARSLYAMAAEHGLQRVGFITNLFDKVGCSPDSLVGENGMLEIKTKAPHLLLREAERDPSTFPPEHYQQCMGSLWVAEREWIDIFMYWPKMKPVVRTLWRDEAAIRSLANDVARFCDQLDALEAKHAR